MSHSYEVRKPRLEVKITLVSLFVCVGLFVSIISWGLDSNRMRAGTHESEECHGSPINCNSGNGQLRGHTRNESALDTRKI